MHRNAPLTPEGRRRLCGLIEDGWTVASSAESMRISRQTAHKWWRRYQEAGEPGLIDRSSRPRSCPTKTPPKVERRVVELRRRHQVSAARLADRAGIPASTLHLIWARHGVSRLSDLERRSGRVVTSHPGELVHVDVKKQAKIPPGGGWKVNGVHGRIRNGKGGRPRLGYAYIHSAVDAYSRLAYSEVHANEQGVTAAELWRRARAFFASYGITVERVMTDNGKCYVSRVFGAELVAAAIVHTRTKIYCPRTNGKVERYNRTSSTNGPMPGPTVQRQPGPERSTGGSTCTTITESTRPSAAHPSAESTTWLGRTPKARWRLFWSGIKLRRVVLEAPEPSGLASAPTPSRVVTTHRRCGATRRACVRSPRPRNTAKRSGRSVGSVPSEASWCRGWPTVDGHDGARHCPWVNSAEPGLYLSGEPTAPADTGD